MNNLITSIIKPAMQYLGIASPEKETELQRLNRERREISEKQTLYPHDRENLKQLDETIEYLQSNKY